METEHELSCGAHFGGARCQPSVSSQATSSPASVSSCTAIKLVARVSREHKCPGQTAGRKCPYSAPVPFRFLDHSLTGVRSLGLRRAVPSHTQLKHSACLFIRRGLPVRQAGAVRGNRARIKLRCTLRGSTLSAINFINRPHQRLQASRLASLVPVSALLKAVRQGARCAVPQAMKALPGIGRSAVAPYETTACGLPCPGGHNTGDTRLSTVTACRSSCADNIINISCQPAGTEKNEASTGKTPGKILPVSQKTIK